MQMKPTNGFISRFDPCYSGNKYDTYEPNHKLSMYLPPEKENHISPKY